MLLVLVLSCLVSMVVGSGGFNFSLAAWWARRMARGISMTANRIIVLVGISFFRFIFFICSTLACCSRFDHPSRAFGTWLDPFLNQVQDRLLAGGMGCNWSDIALFSKAGVNWNDWGILGKAGINWSDFAVLSKTGLNWNDVGVLGKAEIFGSVLYSRHRKEIYDCISV
jgi:hypothetical protein